MVTIFLIKSRLIESMTVGTWCIDQCQLVRCAQRKNGAPNRFRLIMFYSIEPIKLSKTALSLSMFDRILAEKFSKYGEHQKKLIFDYTQVMVGFDCLTLILAFSK